MVCVSVFALERARVYGLACVRAHARVGGCGWARIVGCESGFDIFMANAYSESMLSAYSESHRLLYFWISALDSLTSPPMRGDIHIMFNQR